MSDEKSTIANDKLSLRMKDELFSLAVLASELQVSVGSVINSDSDLSPSAQKSLQAIDRLQQTLEDLGRVAGYLSNQGEHVRYRKSDLRSVVRLRHISHKLTDETDHSFAISDTDNGDVSWF